MKKCCDENTKYLIKYNAGTGSSEWLICKTHYSCDEVFRKNILQIEEVHD